MRPHDVSRRHFLWQAGGGGMALSYAGAPRFTEGRHEDFSGGLHRRLAKRVIKLFMAGAASHVDLLGHKPQLEKLDGQPWDPGESVELFRVAQGTCLLPHGPGKPMVNAVNDCPKSSLPWAIVWMTWLCP